MSRNDREIMSTLREMITFLKGKNEQEIHNLKTQPRQRNTNEVREDTIATIDMGKLQTVLQEDVNTIYDALVVTDFIEEIEVA